MKTQPAKTLAATRVAASLWTFLHVRQLGWLLQVMFMRELMDVLRSPPGHLKLPARRGTFFNRLNPKRPSTGSLPKLLRRCACHVAVQGRGSSRPSRVASPQGL